MFSQSVMNAVTFVRSRPSAQSAFMPISKLSTRLFATDQSVRQVESCGVLLLMSRSKPPVATPAALSTRIFGRHLAHAARR